MLKIAEGGGMLLIAEAGITRRPLELRVVHDQLQACIASGGGEDCSCLKQSIGNRVREICAPHVAHGGLNRSRIEQVALDDFGSVLAEVIRSRIELMNQR